MAHIPPEDPREDDVLDEAFFTPDDIRRLRDIAEQITAVRRALQRTEGLAELLDKQFRFKIGPYKIEFGLDPIVGGMLEIFGLDWIGDMPTTMASLYIVWEAKQAGVPDGKIAKMLAYIGLEFAVDLIPWLGSIADFMIHANTKMVEIMKQYKEELEAKRERIKKGLE